MKSLIALAALSASLVPISAPAQTARPMLDYATAAKMREACLAWATDRKLQMVIAVYDDAGRLLALSHMDGARTGSNQIARDKGLSAATIRIATATLGKTSTGYIPGVMIAGGGIPFASADGVPLGAIGVSGGTSQDDIDCAKSAIAATGLRGPAD